MFAGSMQAAAQSTPDTEASGVSVRAGLAAIVPDADDLPVGYTFVGESFLTAGQLGASGVDAAALTNAGFVTMYVSVYKHADSGTLIRSYASAWTDEAAAEAGFGLLEDEASLLPEASLTDASTDIGQEPRELTTGTYNTDDGSTIGTADVTFRAGNRLLGVAVETSDGSQADAELATSLATRISERADSVQNGESPAHTDLELPGRVISLADQGTELQAGFLGPTEVEGIYGVQGSLLANIQASWVDTVALGQGGNGPIVSVGLSTFSSPDDAAGAVNQSANIFTPLANQQAVEGATLDGADAVVAYQYSSDNAQDNALDSYRILYAVSSDMVVVDIQGASSDTTAADAANQLATVQLGCEGGGACEVPELPTELTGQ